MTENTARAVRHNLRDSPDFSRLAADLRERCGGEGFDFYPSPGNWGDSLLNAGARQFFIDCGLNWGELSRADLDSIGATAGPRRLAVIGGGGGWNRNWPSTISFVQRAMSSYQSVVVLPSTFDYDLIADVDFGESVLYSRSADLRSGPFRFCHDMAFYIAISFEAQSTLSYPLINFRRDKERNSISPNPDRNIDLSILGNASSDHSDLLRIVDRFPEIYTDRLHVAIAGAMLGRRVFLLDGNYGKNRGVYEASLRDNFSNVSFMEWQQFLDLDVVGMRPIGKPGYRA